MSADNGIYIAIFPNGAQRVAHGFASQVWELDSHFYSPEEYKDAVIDIWGKSEEYKTSLDAHNRAVVLQAEIGDTEYGITSINMIVNFGEEKPFTHEPLPPEGSCPHCSSGGSHYVMHGANDSTCKDPALPKNVLIKGFRENTKGVIPEYMARIAMETLEKAGLCVVPIVPKGD